MVEAGQGELLGPTAATGRRGPLEDLDAQSGASQYERGRETVRSRADDDDVRLPAAHSQLEHQRLRGDDDLRVGGAKRWPIASSASSVRSGLVVEEHDAFRAAASPELDGVLRRRVTEQASRRESPR